MPLTAGSRFGAFEIVAQVGAGGMGEVYRARDTRLKRDVALKVLPDTLSGDPQRIARFQHEAELLATLSHPHIASVYGLEVVGDQRALVMELVDGDTLAERIARGPLPLDEALPIARQIIDALEYAHDHRVLHRDLKPANVKMTSDGQVKLLDFGLAKAMDVPKAERSLGGRPELADSPTLTSPAFTEAGIILGTAAYMSPEQARGSAVDERSDVWAFGAVLLEMLVGRQAFTGESVSDTMAAVLRADPDWARLPASTPVAVRRLLERCLVKDRKLRLRAIGDARFALEDSRDVSPPAVATSASSPARSVVPRMVVAALAGAAVAAGVIFASGIARRSVSTEATDEPINFRLTAADLPGLTPTAVFEVSPDGRFIALLAQGSRGGGSEVGVVSLFDRTFTQVAKPQTGGNARLAWSPDSRSLLLRQAGGAVSRFEREGGGVQLVLQPGSTATGSGGLAWGPKDQFLFISPSRDVMLSGLNGEARVVLKAAARRYMSPKFVQAGQMILASQGSAWDSDVVLAALDGSSAPTVLGKGYYPSWVPPGIVVAAQGARLGAWQLDGTKPLAGDGVTLTDQLMLRQSNDVGFSVSKRTLVYRSQQSWATRLTWFDRRGIEAGTLKLDRDCRNPEFSPDGVTVAVECFDPLYGGRDIWFYDLARDVGTRFTTHPADDSDPVWSADGHTLIFTSTRLGENDVFSKSTGGAKPEELLVDLPPDAGNTYSWSPDGTQVLMTSGGSGDIVGFDPRQPAKLVPVLTGPANELEVQFSPDGHFISYSSNESGRYEVYVEPWPRTGDRWQVSTNGGNDGRWRHDGNEMFFITQDRTLWSVPITRTPIFKAGKPVPLFRPGIAGPIGPGHRFPYAVSQDGQRFLMYVDKPGAPPPYLQVIVNWQSLLKAKPESASPR
ncbi:MAG: protein kinase [Vicinamibacterales bacterium]